MKKFKILIDCPWGKAGEILEEQEASYFYKNIVPGARFSIFYLKDYPQLFQEIEEVSDEEFLARKLFDIQKVGMAQQSILYMNLARELIKNGLDVKKLREQK